MADTDNQIAALRQKLDLFIGLCSEFARRIDALEDTVYGLSNDRFTHIAEIRRLEHETAADRASALKAGRKLVDGFSDAMERIQNLEAHCFPAAMPDMRTLFRIIGDPPSESTFDLDNSKPETRG